MPLGAVGRTRCSAMVSTAGLTIVAVAAGLLVAGTVVWGARAGRIGRAAGLVLVAAAVGAVGTFVWLVTQPLVAFHLVHLAYLVGVVTVPMAAVGCIVGALVGSEGRRALLGVGALGVLPALVGLHATHVAPFDLREDQVELPVAPERRVAEPVRVGVLSDLQLTTVTGYEEDAIERLLAAEPDVILIAGDFHQGDRGEFEATLPRYRELLTSLDAPGGVYGVRGDVDGAELDVLLEGTGVRLLDDEVERIELDQGAIVLGGVRLDRSSPSARAVLDDLAASPADELAILLAHRPDPVLDLPPDSRIDLTVAGHTHGGQVALPVLGPITVLSAVGRDVGAGGLHEVAGNPIYVSTGIGLERGGAPQVRILTRPSYGVVDLVPGSGRSS